MVFALFTKAGCRSGNGVLDCGIALVGLSLHLQQAGLADTLQRMAQALSVSEVRMIFVSS